jgi:type III secretion protein J
MRLGSALLVLLLTLFLGGCAKMPVFTDIEEDEANEMIAVLLRSGIPAEKLPGEEGTWSVQVQAPDFERSVRLLGELGFPRPKYRGIGDSFQKSGLVSSPAEERIRFVHALSEDIAKTLGEMDGVLSARVHIVLPGNDPYGKEVQPSSAAVFLKHHPLADLEASVTSVKDLVANSVEGLVGDKVSVVLIPAESAEFFTPPAEPADTNASILGVAVPRTSAAGVWKLVGLLGGAGVVLLGAVAFLGLKLRRIKLGQGGAKPA